MKIEILQLLEGARRAKGLTVIIDVFRAFTTEAMIMSQIPAKLLPVGDIQTALDYKAAHPGTLLCGEREGAIIPGFDYGNSPSQIEFANLAGKAVVHTTSAGTQGIVNATGADEILGGSLINAKAIACYIQKKQPKHVSLVCMGLAGVCPTEEDTLCAEYIRSLLLGQPLADLPERIAHLKETDGAKFFDPAQQSVFPQRDFEIATMADICPFVLRVVKDPETGLCAMERIDVPEAFSLPQGAKMGDFSRAEVHCFPDWLKGRIVYGDYTQPEGDFDAALVLGGVDFLMESRAEAAAELYHAGRCRLFIPTGGVYWDSPYGRLIEAEILKRQMMERGIPEECILLEPKATVTRENFLFCKEILAQRFSDRRRIVTISSAGHVRRSLSLAKAYIPEHDHVAYRASYPTDCLEHFAETELMRRRADKECLGLWAYVDWKLIPDFEL